MPVATKKTKQNENERPKRPTTMWKWMFGTPEERTEAARSLAAARYEKMSKRERKAHAERMRTLAVGHGGPRDPYKLRCDCEVMTLKRAATRGRTEEHKPDCRFHPRHPDADRIPLRELINTARGESRRK